MYYSNFSYLSELFGQRMILKTLDQKGADTAQSKQQKEELKASCPA